MSDVMVVEMPVLTVAGIKRRGSFSDIPFVLNELIGFVMENGADVVGPPFALMHETGSTEDVEKADREGTATIDVNLPIARPVAGNDTVKVYRLQGGRMARILHTGPYDESESAYEALFQWVEENGKQVTGPLREVYLNDPWIVEPEEILTEIYVPIS
ncbi:MAG: GyrI-like domain-containing protein [Dehalococcoidia bacterium]|nr:GyrI-like domain-containing protein [Dehalococcoidia bacterium]